MSALLKDSKCFMFMESSSTSGAIYLWTWQMTLSLTLFTPFIHLNIQFNPFGYGCSFKFYKTTRRNELHIFCEEHDFRSNMLTKSLRIFSITLAWAEMKCDTAKQLHLQFFFKKLPRLNTVEPRKHNQGNQVLRSN